MSWRFILRALLTRSLVVLTTMPWATGAEQDEARFRIPATSTTHRRQELIGGRSSP